MLSTGDILENRYRIVSLLGKGGFGAIYRAWDFNLKQPCAIKENLDTTPQAQRQFEREAQILSGLHHPNLPRVTDHFVVQGQGQYLVMDFIEGLDLQQILEQSGGPLPEAQILPWIEQVCNALEYLHQQNPPIIHRDIKPANIKITPSGHAMLVDFGIAKIYDPHLQTTVGAQAVTPGFSPFEQYGQGGITTPRTDIYALGATLYTLLTGQTPPESIQRANQETLIAPHILNPAISASVEATIMRSLALHPTGRYARAGEFQSALHQPAPPHAKITNFPWWVIALIIGSTVAILGFGIWKLIPPSSTTPTPTMLAFLETITPSLTVNSPDGAASKVFPSLTPADPQKDTPSPIISITLSPTPTFSPSSTLSPTPMATDESSWQQGKLVFPVRQGNGNALYTLDLAADGEPQLLYSAGSDVLLLAPAWSPDSSQIAFHQYSGYLQVIAAQANASPRNLKVCSVATWSGDGSQIACKNNASSSFDILNADDGALIRRISVESGAVLPAWSPVRDEFAYTISNSQGTKIWFRSFNSDLPALLAGDAYENYAPSWSPDGGWIAYQSTLTSAQSEIWIMDREGNNQQQITTTPGGSWSRAPSWSPDGKWLAFVSNRRQSIGSDYGEIFVISLETGETSRITNTGGKVYDWRVSWGQ